MQALEKTVTSRERAITEAARALQATTRTALRKAEPLTQVGVSFGAGTWGGRGCQGCSGSWVAGEGEAKTRIVLSSLQWLPQNSRELTGSQGRRQMERQTEVRMDRHMAAPRAMPITLFSVSYNWDGFSSFVLSFTSSPTLLILLNHTG